MRVLVCGDRNWKDEFLVKMALHELAFQNLGNLTVITGSARGADRIAEKWAREHEISYIGVPAEWSKYGNRAGPRRNALMLEMYKPDLVLAFHDDLYGRSKGTRGMVRLAEEAGVAVQHITHETAYAQG